MLGTVSGSMEEIVVRFFGNLLGRLHGPLTFRLLMQPTMAAILAIHRGLADARKGRPPYLRTLLLERAERRRLAWEGFRSVAMVFTVAVMIDILYQLIAFQWVYPLEAATVAALLAFVPFVIVRGPTNRIASRLRRRKTAVKTNVI